MTTRPDPMSKVGLNKSDIFATLTKVPSVQDLINANTGNDELSRRLISIAGLTVSHIENDKVGEDNQVLQALHAKWKPMATDLGFVRTAPDWALRILLVDCWKDSVTVRASLEEEGAGWGSKAKVGLGPYDYERAGRNDGAQMM